MGMTPFQRTVRAADGVQDDQRQQRDRVGLFQAAAFEKGLQGRQHGEVCEVEK